MLPKNPIWPALFVASSFLCFALPAAADITVLARYTLINGDTLTRPSYYSTRRSRVTVPDGKEMIYDSKDRQLTIIDHVGKRYWTGPLDHADSLADAILAAGRKEVAKVAQADQQAWVEKVQAFNESIHLEQTEEVRKIAGYPSTKWTLSMGEYLQHERWVARSIVVANYGPEIQKAAMALAVDPLGRVLLKALIGMREADGLPLESKTTFKTLTSSGSFGYETIQVIGKAVPATAWTVPEGYTQIQK